MIQIEELTKTYRMGDQEIRALDNISLSISEGEFVAIKGSSGSGKSTLMHILGCLERQDSGQYILEGRNVGRLSDDDLAEVRNRRIGFVFQAFNLLTRISALENVEVPLTYGRDKKHREKALEALRRVGLEDRMDHHSNQLSGGQRQRVAIARAIVTNPAIILADEPTGNLDSKTGKDILGLFEELNRQGATVIIVTHDQEVASRCGRIISLRDGVIIP